MPKAGPGSKEKWESRPRHIKFEKLCKSNKAIVLTNRKRWHAHPSTHPVVRRVQQSVRTWRPGSEAYWSLTIHQRTSLARDAHPWAWFALLWVVRLYAEPAWSKLLQSPGPLGSLFSPPLKKRNPSAYFWTVGENVGDLENQNTWTWNKNPNHSRCDTTVLTLVSPLPGAHSTQIKQILSATVWIYCIHIVAWR